MLVNEKRENGQTRKKNGWGPFQKRNSKRAPVKFRSPEGRNGYASESERRLAMKFREDVI